MNRRSRRSTQAAVGALFSGGLLVAWALTPVGSAAAHTETSPQGTVAADVSTGVHFDVARGRRPVSATQGAAPSGPDFAHWARTRAEFGLESDLLYLRSIAARDDTTSTDLGIPLTADEAKNIEARNSLGQYVGAIQKYGEASPYFGGVEVDQSTGGVIEIDVVAGSPKASLDELQRVLSADVAPGVPTRFVSVPYSYNDIEDADEAIGADLDSGQLAADAVNSLFQDGETLTIGIDANAPATAEADLTARYPWSYVKVVRGAGGVVLDAMTAPRPRLR